METRTRSKRAAATTSSSAPQPQREAPENARQKPADSTHARATARGNQADSAYSANSKPGSLTADPVARRNARVSHARSIASLPPTQTGSEDEDEEDDAPEGGGDQSAGESGVEEDGSDGNTHEQERQGTARERLDIMTFTLPDLAKASTEFMKSLQTANYSSAVSRQMLKMKRNAFLGFREAYDEPDSDSIFLSRAWLNRVANHPDFSQAASKVLATANLATALDNIEHLRASDTKEGALSFLQELDESFPDALAILDDPAKYTGCALDIRTAYLIEALAAKSKGTDPRAVVASVFCEPMDSKDYPYLFSHGPFRRLGGSDDPDADTRLCSDRVLELMPVIRSDKKTAGLAQLRKNFPLDAMLGQLKVWVLEVYQAPVQAAEGDEFYDAEEDQVSQSQSVAETQSIIRAPGKEKPLFVSSADLDHLKSPYAPRARKLVPTSGQQHARRQSGKRVRDAYDIENMGDGDEGGADDDDDDPFETDTRAAVRDGKRRALQTSDHQSKRQQMTSSLPVRESAAGPSSSMPPPARPSINNNNNNDNNHSPSSSQDIAQLKQDKLAYVQSVRAQRSPTFKQRHVWTDRDATLLIDLVRAHGASWSSIEKAAPDAGFDHVRNQQAYRDKARNMKVDFLITNAVLPPYFDAVVLGKKEIDRLISLGKNPFRKEGEVTAAGDVTNTEWTDEGDDE